MTENVSLFRLLLCTAIALAAGPGCEKQRAEAPAEPATPADESSPPTPAAAEAGSTAKLVEDIAKLSRDIAKLPEDVEDVFGKQVQSEDAPCPAIEKLVASFVEENRAIVAVIPEPYSTATRTTDKHVGLQLAGTTVAIPNRPYAVVVYDKAAWLDGEGLRITLMRMPSQIEPVLRPAFSEGTTQFDVMSRSLRLSVNDVSCEPGSELRAAADLYLLTLKMVLFPWSDAADPPPRYHSYTGPEGRWFLQHKDAEGEKSDDELELIVGTEAGGVWMVSASTTGSVLEAVVLDADIPVAEDSVGQLAVRYVEGDACAAKQLLASHEIKKGAEYLEARAKECQDGR